jgi:hypothetical protein
LTGKFARNVFVDQKNALSLQDSGVRLTNPAFLSLSQSSSPFPSLCLIMANRSYWAERSRQIELQHESASVHYGNAFRDAIKYTIPISLREIHRDSEQSYKHRFRHRDITRILADGKHAVIKGFDGSILAYRASLNDDDILTALNSSIEKVPKKRSASGDINRHYCVTTPRADAEAHLSQNYGTDGVAAHDFISANNRLWDAMTSLLCLVYPGIHRNFRRYPLPNDIDRLCGAWTGCSVNVTTNSPPKTEVATDTSMIEKNKCSWGVSCLCAFGEFSGGAVVFPDLRLILEMRPGDLLLFPDHRLNYYLEPVTGKRHSVLTCVHENMSKFWQSKFGFVTPLSSRKGLKKKGGPSKGARLSKADTAKLNSSIKDASKKKKSKGKKNGGKVNIKREGVQHKKPTQERQVRVKTESS